MKAMQFVKLDFFRALFFLFVAWMLFSIVSAHAGETTSASADSSKLALIEKRLAESESREKEILENQKTILAEIKKTQVWVRHR